MKLATTKFITEPNNIPALASAPTAKAAYLRITDQTASQEQQNLVAAIKQHNIPIKLLNDTTQKSLINQNNSQSNNLRQMVGRKLIFIGQQANTKKPAPENIKLHANYSCISIKLTNDEFQNLDDCFLPLPNDAALIYEGEYARTSQGKLELDANNWPVVIESSATMDKQSRALIRSIYPQEKLITISKAEALAHATNAVVLQSPINGRYKLFVNGKRSANIFVESNAIAKQLLSMHYTTIKKIIEITNNIVDVIEIPYKKMHSCGHSVSSTIIETTSANDSCAQNNFGIHYFYAAKSRKTGYKI